MSSKLSKKEFPVPAGKVIGIFRRPKKKMPMEEVTSAKVIKGKGIEGDAYCDGKGSFNQDEIGKRQITFINAKFFKNSGFNYADSRRNIITAGVELNRLYGKIFTINGVRYRGLKYCEPCNSPKSSTNKNLKFSEVFHDNAGIVAEILDDGEINLGDTVIPPPKSYQS